MSDDLKPCPFCGGEPEWVDIPDDKFSNTGGSVIECMSCGASTHVEFGFKENLIDTWNRRAASRELVPTMADRIEELEAKLAAHDAEVYRRGQEDMRERAARVPDIRASEYDREFGSYDGSTGVTEYPGNGCEWVEEWETISAAIRALPIKEKDNE